MIDRAKGEAVVAQVRRDAGWPESGVFEDDGPDPELMWRYIDTLEARLRAEVSVAAMLTATARGRRGRAA